VVVAVAHISEAWLQPLLESLLGQFPFRIRGGCRTDCVNGFPEEGR
jgi:hypothetical protein